MYLEMISADPDEEVVSIGMRNAKLAGVQGTLQLAIIFVMCTSGSETKTDPAGMRWEKDRRRL